MRYIYNYGFGLFVNISFPFLRFHHTGQEPTDDQERTTPLFLRNGVFTDQFSFRKIFPRILNIRIWNGVFIFAGKSAQKLC